MTGESETPESHRLVRRFGLLSATALNMTNMMGAGPFITIPLLMSAMGGPQALLGWVVALVIVICDGMVWSELGAAMPGSGGSFNYLRAAFGQARFGRLMGFLFVWQFVLSGPLEIASGYIGFAQYAGYLWSGLTRGGTIVAADATEGRAYRAETKVTRAGRFDVPAGKTLAALTPTDQLHGFALFTTDRSVQVFQAPR